MKRYEGIHFYINIKNYNSIILDEEKRYGSVNRSIHALDTFFPLLNHMVREIIKKHLSRRK